MTVIEWAERAEDELPEECLSVYLTYVDENSREIGFLGEGERYRETGGGTEEGTENRTGYCKAQD